MLLVDAHGMYEDVVIVPVQSSSEVASERMDVSDQDSVGSGSTCSPPASQDSSPTKRKISLRKGTLHSLPGHLSNQDVNFYTPTVYG